MRLLLAFMLTLILPQSTRLGIGFPWQNGDPAVALETLQYPQWTNWIYDHAGQPGYTPMLWQGDKDAAGSTVSNWSDALEAANAYPSVLWFLGNEPESEYESDTTPEVFAESVIEWQRLTQNPIALPGIYVSAWMEWQAWMDAYLDAGGPIPDKWSIHIYASTPTVWESAYMLFVEWMTVNDAVRPVIVSETSAAQLSTKYHLDIMQSLPHLLDTLPHLDSVYWYSSRHFTSGGFAAGNLLDADGNLTELGAAWLGLRIMDAEPENMVFLPMLNASPLSAEGSP